MLLLFVIMTVKALPQGSYLFSKDTMCGNQYRIYWHIQTLVTPTTGWHSDEKIYWKHVLVHEFL